jgi:hypothetical protein
MRRNYISPEFFNIKTSGTLSMLEESNYFGSKMLEIEDYLIIDNERIVYYQNDKKEQENLAIESNFPIISFSSSDEKKNNHTLEIDKSQPIYQIDNNTRWILKINLKNILVKYIFSILKGKRTFEGITNSMTPYNNIDIAIEKYIEMNILNRYKLKGIELFIIYRDLRNQNILRFKNEWPTVENENVIRNINNKLNKFQTETAFDGSIVKITFNQEKPSTKFKFDYYFNLIYEKI